MKNRLNKGGFSFIAILMFLRL